MSAYAFQIFIHDYYVYLLLFEKTPIFKMFLRYLSFVCPGLAQDLKS